MRVNRNIPGFYRWGGPDKYPWSFGWETGMDGDMIVVTPKIITEDGRCELFLSPVCSNRFLAFVAFLAKWFLVKVDHNINLLSVD